MTLTTIDAAQDVFLALLLNDNDLADLVTKGRVTLGQPLNTPSDFWDKGGVALFISERVDPWTVDTPDLPNGSRAETFGLHLIAVSTAKTFTLARNAAMTVCRRVNALLEPDWTLGGLVLNAYAAGGAVEGGPITSGAVCEINMTVNVSAYVGAP